MAKADKNKKSKKAAYSKFIKNMSQDEFKRRLICLNPDETWETRVTIIQESLMAILETLMVTREIAEQDEDMRLFFKAIHLFTTRALLTLNIRRKKLAEVLTKNDNGKYFKDFMKRDIKDFFGDDYKKYYGKTV